MTRKEKIIIVGFIIIFIIFVGKISYDCGFDKGFLNGAITAIVGNK